MLSSSKNYLQLNKITSETLNPLLLGYMELKGSEADETVNSVLENYFGRNDIRANDYFNSKP